MDVITITNTIRNLNHIISSVVYKYSSYINIINIFREIDCCTSISTSCSVIYKCRIKIGIGNFLIIIDSTTQCCRIIYKYRSYIVIGLRINKDSTTHDCCSVINKCGIYIGINKTASKVDCTTFTCFSIFKG